MCFLGVVPWHGNNAAHSTAYKMCLFNFPLKWFEPLHIALFVICTINEKSKHFFWLSQTTNMLVFLLSREPRDYKDTMPPQPTWTPPLSRKKTRKKKDESYNKGGGTTRGGVQKKSFGQEGPFFFSGFATVKTAGGRYKRGGGATREGGHGSSGNK